MARANRRTLIESCAAVSLRLLVTTAVKISGFEVLSTTWKSTDGTASHWKYIIGNAIVYRDVYRADLRES